MNLKEEINRIKSLFTEERLYGNLVNETAENPDKDGNKVISKAEFKDTGFEITPEEAMEFIDSSSDKKILRIEDCDTVIENTGHLKCVKEAFDDSSVWEGREQIFKQSASVGCAIQMTRVNAYLDVNFMKTIFDNKSEYNPTNTLSTLTFWQFGRYKGLQKTFALLMEFKDPIPKCVYFDSGKSMTVTDVKFIRLRGGMNDSCDITDLYMDQVEHSKGVNNLSDSPITTFGEINTVKKLLSKISKT